MYFIMRYFNVLTLPQDSGVYIFELSAADKLQFLVKKMKKYRLIYDNEPTFENIKEIEYHKTCFIAKTNSYTSYTLNAVVYGHLNSLPLKLLSLFSNYSQPYPLKNSMFIIIDTNNILKKEEVLVTKPSKTNSDLYVDGKFKILFWEHIYEGCMFLDNPLKNYFEMLYLNEQISITQYSFYIKHVI